MSRSLLIEQIKNVLNLNLYEARVYLSIVAYGPIEQKQIFKKSCIPQSRVYDTVVSLKNRGLVNSFVRDKKEYYHALDPKHSINAYLTQIRWDHEKEIEKERINFEKKIKLQKEEFFKTMRQKEAKSKKLISSLQKIYSKQIPSDDELFQYIRGESNLVNHIAEQVKSSKRNIKNISLPPYLPEALIWENISSKLKNGLKYFHLAYSGLLFEWGLWRINEDQKAGVNFRFLPKDHIKYKFYIFDDRSSFVRLRDPITNNFSDHGILIRDINWVIDLKEKFDNLWKNSLSLKEVEKKILLKKEEISKKLNEDENKVLNQILERGKYATLQNLSLKNTEQILKSLERKKLIVTFKKATLGYIANISYFLGSEHSF